MSHKNELIQTPYTNEYALVCPITNKKECLRDKNCGGSSPKVACIIALLHTQKKIAEKGINASAYTFLTPFPSTLEAVYVDENKDKWIISNVDSGRFNFLINDRTLEDLKKRSTT